LHKKPLKENAMKIFLNDLKDNLIDFGNENDKKFLIQMEKNCQKKKKRQ
jgi:hypothetical protein